jgi:dTDP-4-dehydrorhamnose reductase
MNILLLGKNGQLGRELQRSLAPLGALTAWGRETADLSLPERLAALVMAAKPDIIVNAAAYTAVDKAESEPAQADRINANAPAALAHAARELGCRLVHYSTDYVFDGLGATPWMEAAPRHPHTAYGASKLAGEQAITASGCDHLIFRTSWVYAKEGGNFAKTMLRLACERDHLSVIDDQVGAPTDAAWLADMTATVITQQATPLYMEDLPTLASNPFVRFADISPTAQGQTNTTNASDACLVLPCEVGGMSQSDRGVLRPRASGIFHAANAGEVSWYGYASYLIARARQLGFPIKVAPEAIRAVPSSAFPSPARRPLNSRLDCSKLTTTFGITPPPWQQGIDQLLTHLHAQL